MVRLATTSIFLVLSFASFGQSPRLHDAHSLGWLVYVGDHQMAPKWAVHTEFQLRRVDWLRDPQQLMARLGLVRALGTRVKASVGYTYFQSHRYGAYAEVPGRAEPENRLYEDLTLQDQLGRLGLKHRVRLEQRWLGSRAANGQGPVQQWEYQNRIRYQLAATFPLQGAKIDDNEFYLTGFDELFIGFGQNVNQNVFNQNRLSGGVGFQVTTNAKAEINYLYQVRSHAAPDPASGQPVVELNHGVTLNLIYNIDFTKSPQP